MGVTKETTVRRDVKLAWALALVLYGFCWLLPIMSQYESTKPYVGFDGARVAHEEFWNLITKGRSIDSASDVVEVIFFAIGWLSNELFVLGAATFLRRPRIALRSFAFSLGIMISWQIGFWKEFPLLIGYWYWVAAGAIALWLAATRMARETRHGVGAVLAEPTTLALLLVPILNAVLLKILGDFT